MNTRRFSKKQETKVAKAVGGKRQSNSGATPFRKGDVVTDNMLIECKTSTRDVGSVAIKKEWLDKASEEAFAMGKQYSVLAFDFGPTLPNNKTFYIINERLFGRLLQCMEEDTW